MTYDERKREVFKCFVNKIFKERGFTHTDLDQALAQLKQIEAEEFNQLKQEV